MNFLVVYYFRNLKAFSEFPNIIHPICHLVVLM